MAEAVKGRLGQKLQELSQLIEEATTPYTEKEKMTSKPKDGVARKAGARPSPRSKDQDLTQFVEEATLPYTGKETAKNKPKEEDTKRTGPRPKTKDQSSVSEQIKLEAIRGENLNKEVGLSCLKLELAKLKGAEVSLIESTPIWSSMPSKKDMDNFEIPSLYHLHQQSSSQKGIFLPSMYLFSTKGTTSYEKIDISKFVCGFLEMIRTCEKCLQSILLD